MLTIDGKTYAIDMDALMAWVSSTPSSERNVATTITETYPMMTDESDEIEVASKEIMETKASMNETMNNIRYDFVKMLINMVLDQNTYDTLAMPISQRLAFNTLLLKKIIIEVEE